MMTSGIFKVLMDAPKDMSIMDQFEAESLEALERLQSSPYIEILQTLAETPQMLTIREIHKELGGESATYTQSQIAKALEWMYSWDVVDSIQKTESGEEVDPPDPEYPKEGPGGVIDTYWHLTQLGSLLAKQF